MSAKGGSRDAIRYPCAIPDDVAIVRTFRIGDSEHYITVKRADDGKFTVRYEDKYGNADPDEAAASYTRYASKETLTFKEVRDVLRLAFFTYCISHEEHPDP